MDDKDKQKLIEENEKLKKENARLKEILEGKKIKEINIKLKKENEELKKAIKNNVKMPFDTHYVLLLIMKK